VRAMGPDAGSALVTGAEVTRRVLRAALRRSPSPFEQRLALAEYERIQRELWEAEAEAIAAYHGQADSRGQR
jgi:hypothetical protein